MSYPSTDINTETVVASNNQFDIKKFLFRLLGFLPWIILSVLVCNVVARLYLRYSPKMHAVSAHVLIKDDEENSADYKVLRELGVMPGSKEVQNQIDILESYGLMESIADSLQLNIELTTEARIASSTLYGRNAPVFIYFVNSDTARFDPAVYKLKLYEDGFSVAHGKQDKELKNYKYNDTIFLNNHYLVFKKNDKVKFADDGYNLAFKNTHSVAMGLKNGIDVRKLHDMGGIIEISLIDQDPQRAIDIINTLIKTYNTAGVIDKNVVGVKTVRFLRDRIDTVSEELNTLEVKEQVFKSGNKIADVSGAGNEYLQQAMSYDKLRIEQLGQLDLLQSLEKFLRSSNKLTDIIPSSNGIDEPTLMMLIQQYNDAVLNFQNQSEISTEKDPVLDRIKTNLIELKGNILKNIQSIRSGYQTRLSQLRNNQSNYEGLLASVPEKERQLIGLKRQIGVKEQLYLYLLQKKEETELALSSNINNTRVVDEAYDKGIVLPKSKQVLSFALMIGICLPIGVMLLIDFFNNRITDKAQIEQGTETPVIGELSFDKKKQEPVVFTKSRSILAEQFRLIKTNINYMGGDDAVKTILVTSFMSGEGKSFTSINLASTLASSECKVLLFELDLRKPKIARYLNIEPKYGITDLLVNNFDYKKAITSSPKMKYVDIITCGTIPPNPTELLSGNKLKCLIEKLKEEYDYIIIDTSPVGLVADAFSLEKYVDLCLFITRHKHSYKTTIRYIETLYQKKRFKKLGLVVNGILDKGFSYGYGYNYGYYYGNGNGYYDNQEKGNWINRLLFRLK
ncbi:MAG: GumC family protein [Ilyomonas sp.]